MKNLFAILIFSSILFATAQENQSPYLLVSNPDAIIPLKASKTQVHISGTIAHVQLTQVYHNLGETAIEAKYMFPLSIQAAVHKMTMRIGNRTITAKIFEKQEAQKVYKQALREGKRAAKLDQERPNIFQMSVGNIMPKDEVTIDIYYTELLVPVHGEYQFVAPAVVGPRYTGENSSKETVFNTPYTKEGIADTFDYLLSVQINAGITIKNVASSSHKIQVDYSHQNKAEVVLLDSNVNPANRDFILNYSLRGNSIQTGLLLYEHEEDNYFVYLMEPTKKVLLKDIPSREYLFIVDVSGSMNGYPLEVSKSLMRNLLCNLRPSDTFNVQLFASSSTMFSPFPVVAEDKYIEAAIRFLSEGQGGGGTQLLSALKKAYELPRQDPTSARSMVIITDGYVSVEKEAFELIRKNLDQANVFTFGIGSSVNRYLIEGMAKVSQSESFIATTKEEALKVAAAFKTYIASPLLTQIKLKAKGFDIYDVTPSSIPDVFSARPVVVYGKYRGKPQGKLILTGYQGKKKFKQEYKVTSKDLDSTNTALRYLWARKKIEILDDYKKLFYEDVKEKVVSLGLKYNLLTQYTSFVAVDETIVNKDGTLKTSKQSLPMPQHTTNMAVGAAAEIKGKSNFKKSYVLLIKGNENLTKTNKRSLKMMFKAIYSKLVKKYLLLHAELRLKFDANGVLLGVEVKENNIWKLDNKLTTTFLNSAVKLKTKVHSPITILIKR
ncbi:MAG: VIT and VWA domain-containing protein [Cellulophaga sp.]